MKRKSGFTLIELVIVIIILGILAAVAVPKFIDLQGDARASAMQGVKAALEDGATLTYSQAAIEGKEKASSGLSTKSDVDIAFGYPTATLTGIIAAVELSQNDWTIDEGSDTTALIITVSGSTSTIGECEVTYLESSTGERPFIEAIVDGC